MSAPAPPACAGGRNEAMDALRGLALAGIAQVNIQCFAWGSGPALGYLTSGTGGESLLYFLQASFIEAKFYPVFGFLFGASMALQLGRLRRRPGGGQQAAARYRRRLAVLAILGVAHATLLFFGDVLAAYAACALAFLSVMPRRSRDLVRLLVVSWVVVLGLLALPPLLSLAIAPERGAPVTQIPPAVLMAHQAYAEGSFAVALRQRFIDAVWQQALGCVFFWPQVFALIALGVLATRQGWLRHPRRHARVWRRAAILGLTIGLPCALAGAALEVQRMRVTPGADPGWETVLGGAGSLLAAAYVAAALRLLARPTAARRWLADAGRVSLTNYLLQSLLMAELLEGWGLGLARSATRGELALMALAIFAVCLLLSRWLVARHGQGPAEALWRRWAYG